MIKEILQSLSVIKNKEIMNAFNNGEECIIPLEDGKFLAVNTVVTEQVIILESKGVWLYGQFK